MFTMHRADKMYSTVDDALVLGYENTALIFVVLGGAVVVATAMALLERIHFRVGRPNQDRTR